MGRIKMVWLNFRLFPWEMQKMHFFHPKSCSNKIRKFPKVTKAEYQSLRINHLFKKFVGITVRTFSKAYEIAYWMKGLIPENGSSFWNLKLFNFNSKDGKSCTYLRFWILSNGILSISKESNDKIWVDHPLNGHFTFYSVAGA